MRSRLLGLSALPIHVAASQLAPFSLDVFTPHRTMKFNYAILILLLCGISQSTSADRDQRFFVNVHGRFLGEALPYWSKGSELMDKGNLQGARQNFDAAIRADPKIWPVYLDRAQVFIREGKWELALQDCNSASRLQPKFYRTFIMRATIYSAMGRCREGLADLDRIISFRPDSEIEALALSQRGWLRATCHDPAIRDLKRALADATQACKLSAWRQASYIGTLAICYAANGDFEGAIRYQQQAINTGRYSTSELRDAEKRLSSYQHHKAL
jgi:tetratricopeptide (TPR) repeat protein